MPLGQIFLILAMLAILFAPRRYALLPILIGTCYMTLAQGIEIGSLNFFCIRILIATGFLRALLRGEPIAGPLTSLDRLMLISAVWAMFSSIFHTRPGDAFVGSLGLIYNTCGIYFLVRIYCTTSDDVSRVFRMVCVLLIPLGVEMLLEQATSYNSFSALGGVSAEPAIREGRLRAQGPFAHAILAGTVGAVCLPFAVALWNKSRTTAVLGTLSCIVMVITSASSGPVMSGIFALLALALWRFRAHIYLLRRGFVALYLILALAMEAPVYYLIARIDLAGGSTGWHRARLIESAFQHFDEWWLAGTDYTRHWMPTGVSWSWDHTDITSQYLQLGVVGGLPLMLLFIRMLWLAFASVGRQLRAKTASGEPLYHDGFIVWALGASLFAHAVTSISVSYFDQSFVFLYMVLACIASLDSEGAAQEQAPATPPGHRGAMAAGACHVIASNSANGISHVRNSRENPLRQHDTR